MCLKIFILILFLTSCARQGSINFNGQRLGEVPARIVWLQIPGLDWEHLALTKFVANNDRGRSSFESASCYGNLWLYNAEEIRPDVELSLMSQLMGDKAVSNDCETFSKKSLMSIMSNNNFNIGLMERQAGEFSILKKASKCNKLNEYIGNSKVWSSEKPYTEKYDYFHFQERNYFDQNNIFFDKSCQRDIKEKHNCYSSLSDNAYLIFNEFYKNKKEYFFIIQDFSFYRAIKKRDIVKARSSLQETERILSFLMAQSRNDPEMLIVLSSTSARRIEFPEKGLDWKNFNSLGEGALYKRVGLTAPILSIGARSENLCGIYSESEILGRIANDKNRKFQFYIVNPFN